MSLPTYYEAVRTPSSRDALQMVSSYMNDGRDLASCCLVSKEWFGVFTDVLWENPLSKITSQASFAKFYNLLPFSPSASKIRVLDSRQWFCDPQNLLAGRAMAMPIDAFKEESIHRRSAVMEGEEESWEITAPKAVQAAVRRLATSNLLNNVHFLIMNSNVNLDLLGFNLMELWDRRPLLLSLEGVHLALNGVVELAQTRLPFFDRVRYLSFSNSVWHSTALIRVPLSLFGMFANVVVLKLRNCGLTDHDVSILRKAQLAPGPGQLTCLDLRDNHLTDGCIRDLNQFSGHLLSRRGAVFPYKTTTMIEAAPQYEEVAADHEHQIRHGIDPDAETIPDDVDAFISWAREHGELETMPNTGLRQLYISGNSFTFKAVLFVLLIPRTVIRTFSCDASPAGMPVHDGWTRYLPPAYKRNEMLDGSPIPLIVALCSHHHAPKLERLTIHHSFVTYSPASRDPGAPMGPGEQYGVVATPNEMWRFLPEVNNNIQHLELVGVPAYGSPELLRALEHFLFRAAQIEYDLKGYRATQPMGRRAPRILPGLRKLVIVLANKSEEELASVTEDQDAERFMKESENDFSFFEEEKGRGKKSAVDEELERSRSGRVDIRAGLAAYRKGTRAAYEALKKEKGVTHAERFVDPHYHWGGELVVVRPSGW